MIALPAGAITFARTWWRVAAGVALAAPLFLVLGHCHGVSAERDRANLAREVENRRVEAVDARAKEEAAEHRGQDNAAVKALQSELNDAVENLPDSTPSARRLALACARLRQQGTDTSALPACR